ncbi:hypothetical protein OLX02_04645 [Novosphingobium sp. KCTC 2891]|uniref:hypothetical protein n=1 Tax=Novosphingobium sp. KCTC 2891 TaxID=2989730 RepID=UPI002222EFCD|nr:hypothetical protein [Novosphingobium sp. KCTC 2891]MCW1382101.1 hypothetical protein [Novosphingobium sp. KCTC 2891]
MATAFQSTGYPASSGAAPGTAMPGAGRAEFGNGAGTALSMKWSALHDASAVVCALAGLAPENRKAEVRNFPAIMRDTGGWRYDEARRGVDDLAAIMEPGLSALLAVHARGVSAVPAALALWQEFLAARAALLELVPPLGIKRRA